MSRGGRPPLCGPEVLKRVARERVAGLGPTRIAEQLNREGIRTPADSERWSPQTIHQLLHVTVHGQNALRRAQEEQVRLAGGVPWVA